MAKSFRRPRTQAELDHLELRGLWQAQALAKDIAEGDDKITIEVILRVHRVFFESSQPEIAGRFRAGGENIKKLKCIEPMAGRRVAVAMQGFWRELDTRLAFVPRHPARQTKTYQNTWFNKVLDIATWTQHQLAFIHPFCEGNGRMARIMTNLILRRYGLQPSQIKYEGEDKTRYLEALCQIDRHQNYGPLKLLIVESVRSTYQKLYEVRQRKARDKSRR